MTQINIDQLPVGPTSTLDREVDKVLCVKADAPNATKAQLIPIADVASPLPDGTDGFLKRVDEVDGWVAITQSDVTGLTDALSAKATTTALTEGLALKSNTGHTHAQADVTSLVSDLSTITSNVSGKEPVLGNPTTDGQSLVSTSAGVRSWAMKQPYFDPSTCIEFFDDFSQMAGLYNGSTPTFAQRMGLKWSENSGGNFSGFSASGDSKVVFTTGAVLSQARILYSRTSGINQHTGLISALQPFEFYCGVNANNTDGGVITIGMAYNYDAFATQCFAFVLDTNEIGSQKGKWSAGHSNTGVASNFYSDVVGSTTMVHLKIIFDGTTVSYYINGNLIGSGSQNLPNIATIDMHPTVKMINSTATARTISIDYIMVRSFNHIRS